MRSLGPPDLQKGPARDVAERARRQRGGQLLNLYRTLLHSPALADGWLHLGTAVRYEIGLEDGLRELVTCQVARLTASDYEWAQHAPLALAAGYTQSQLDALGRADLWGVRLPEDRDVLELVACVVRDARPPDLVVEAVRERHGDAGFVEVVGVASYYVAVSRFLKTLDVEIDGTERTDGESLRG